MMKNLVRNPEKFDVVVVGGGPAGATAACDLAEQGVHVLLLDRLGRIKPCGGAIPPKLMDDFDIPNSVLEARATSARMISPASKKVDMDIGGFVGMVDRETYDAWLRSRAQHRGAEFRSGTFLGIEQLDDGMVRLSYRNNDSDNGDSTEQVLARCVIGADGARSKVAQQIFPNMGHMPCVFAYHEIIESPSGSDVLDFDGSRCDVYYQGKISPDFYGWIFPHGDKLSVGTGSAIKGFSLRDAVRRLRTDVHMEHLPTIRCEGAPIPLRPLKRWDNGQNVILAGDAAGVVAPASGEGIYYAMTSGRVVADSVYEFLETADPKCLKSARKVFMKQHGRVFWILRMMQYFWYQSDKRRERFVNICQDKDVQRLTWQAYMDKKLVRGDPIAHTRIFFKDLAHLLGVAST